MDSVDIRKTFVDSQGLLNYILKVTRNSKVANKKKGVEYLGQSQVQNLLLQVIEEVQGELLVKTLQYHTTKGKFGVNSMVKT